MYVPQAISSLGSMLLADGEFILTYIRILLASEYISANMLLPHLYFKWKPNLTANI